jgi:hypothetical protein
MFAWAGYIESYQMLASYHTGGRSNWFVLNPVKEQPGAEDIDIEVKFVDHEVSPGATFGHVSSLPGGGSKIEVELPLDGLHTFWRAIGDAQEQDCIVAVVTNEDLVITSLGR